MRKGLPPTLAQTVWRRSERLKQIGSEALTAYNADRLTQERCGAKRKRDGKPCEGIAMPNGRCRVHGGATPSGDQWHRMQFPTKDRPGALQKWERKRRDHERARLKRERRLAAMTPEERAKHEAWQRAHKPGSVHERAQKRADRKMAAEFRARLDQSEPSKGGTK